MSQAPSEIEVYTGQHPHAFHIPVMGPGFTIDTALRVAKFGISSVVSLIDDVLIEQMRKFHCEREGEPYEPIAARDPDARANRITAYLNLLDRLVHRQTQRLQATPFEPGSEITQYFEMLPDTPLQKDYRQMLATTDPVERERKQERLRTQVVSGSIDVNIMCKIDPETYQHGEKLPPEHSGALAGLRGFANSTLRSSIVLSAGMNHRLYGYIGKFPDFFPNEHGVLKKKLVLKVSDYRSAVIQGKFLAKRGLWISEYRIESGLNCGGHAFATTGHLMGPILAEFKANRQKLIETLHEIYIKGLADRCSVSVDAPHAVRVTVQGGIGHADENELLRRVYGVDATGWGTPFLLVRDVINMTDADVAKLSAATEKDVYLSDSSPLGVPFWNLRNSESEQARRSRIHDGKPGSPCPKGYLVSNTEFTERPLCHASRSYQSRKLESLPTEGLTIEELQAQQASVVQKSCICHDLSGPATLKNGIDPGATPAICCGPNIVNFSKPVSLEEMINHIYGRICLIMNPERPHMFIRELSLYRDHLRKELERYSKDLSSRTPKYFREFKDNLLTGIEYYRKLAEQFVEEQRDRFVDHLNYLCEEIESIPLASTLGPKLQVAANPA